VDDTELGNVAERIDQIFRMTFADIKKLLELCVKVVYAISLWFTFDFNHKIAENQKYV
jgi:hypothetical protein